MDPRTESVPYGRTACGPAPHSLAYGRY